MACKKSVENNRLSVESKESSYMGFDRGIDSDIEIEQGCRSVDAQGNNSNDPLTAGRSSSEPHLKSQRIALTPKLARWESLDPPESTGDSETMPPESKIAEIGKSNALVQMKKFDLENGIENTNQKLTLPLNDLKTILPNHRTSPGSNSGLSPVQAAAILPHATTNNGASSYHSLGMHSVARSRFEASQMNKKYTSESLLNMLSGIYAKLLIVMGICFPIAEVMSKKIPTSYYEGFYLYLYGLSIAYLFFMYCFILREKREHKSVTFKEKFLLCFKSFKKTQSSVEQSDDCSSHHSSLRSINQSSKLSRTDESQEYTHCYLRLGVVAFGIASMIYSGLEFGQFFELQPGTPCYNVLFGISPIARMAFIFIQMYFIFLNSQICIKRYQIVARFGLMHLIATNICIWLHVLVQETKHGILNLMNVNLTLPMASSVPLNILAAVSNDVNFTDLIFDISGNASRVERSIHEQLPQEILECRRSNIMGELVQEASHFLFPCTIQYSLICAAILYIMWKNIGKAVQTKIANTVIVNTESFSSTIQRQYNHVDCTKANKGLFTGILVLVLSIISIILFYVLISKPTYKGLAITEARITELGLYLLTSVAVAVALIQVRELKYSASQDTELNQILLIVAQSGLYLYIMFSIIGGHFTSDQNTLLVLLTSSACIIQATLQTIFILDASNCYASTTDQLRRKPGRELVTFLLVCNFAMWAMNTLQTQRPDSNPIQLEFYGLWTWTVITYVTTPLSIYFRFHSTVCLCAIWKKTYKLRTDYV